jgi:CDGSH-type Zn-finger protein
MPVELEKGKNYAWCSCGESTNQPWCDGKHKGSSFKPLVFTAEEDKTGWMCTCKHSSKPEFCDGSHKQL